MAAPTWTVPDTGRLPTNAKGVAATGTANDAPTADEGVDCNNIQAVEVTLQADSGQTLSGAGTLEAWFKVPQGGWARAKEFDLSVAATGIAAATYRTITFQGPSPGRGIPIIARQGRAAWVPNGVTVSSGGATIYLDGLAAGRAA